MSCLHPFWVWEKINLDPVENNIKLHGIISIKHFKILILNIWLFACCGPGSNLQSDDLHPGHPDGLLLPPRPPVQQTGWQHVLRREGWKCELKTSIIMRSASIFNLCVVQELESMKMSRSTVISSFFTTMTPKVIRVTETASQVPFSLSDDQVFQRSWGLLVPAEHPSRRAGHQPDSCWHCHHLRQRLGVCRLTTSTVYIHVSSPEALLSGISMLTGSQQDPVCRRMNRVAAFRGGESPPQITPSHVAGQVTEDK